MNRKIEFLAVLSCMFGIAVFLAIQTGSVGLSWDALNHHIYLGFISESPRWHLDVAAAASQTYQYPYVYWPFYRLTQLGLSGTTAAVLWSTFQIFCIVPPLWLASVRLVGAGRDDWESRVFRFVGCCLGCTSILVLAAVAGSANDLLAATPMLWAVALALSPGIRPARAVAPGVLVGISLSLKFSNILCVPLFMAALCALGPFREMAKRLFFAGSAAAAGFLITYAPWGWQLWVQFGNPVYPHFDAVFRQ